MVEHESGYGIDVVLEDDEVVEQDHSHQDEMSVSFVVRRVHDGRTQCDKWLGDGHIDED